MHRELHCVILNAMKMQDLVNKVKTRRCFICCVCQMFTYLTV
jgi:hypothetical protein